MAIVCKSAAEIEKMRRSGGIVRQVLNHVRGLVVPGATTMDLERAAEQQIKDLGVKPAFKGYYDYPCVLCTSINEEIVHGIPSEKRVLKAGDIVSIDCGVVLDGYYGAARGAKGNLGQSGSAGARSKGDGSHRRWQLQRALRTLRCSHQRRPDDFDAVRPLSAVSDQLSVVTEG